MVPLSRCVSPMSDDSDDEDFRSASVAANIAATRALLASSPAVQPQVQPHAQTQDEPQPQVQVQAQVQPPIRIPTRAELEAMPRRARYVAIVRVQLQRALVQAKEDEHNERNVYDSDPRGYFASVGPHGYGRREHNRASSAHQLTRSQHMSRSLAHAARRARSGRNGGRHHPYLRANPNAAAASSSRSNANVDCGDSDASDAEASDLSDLSDGEDGGEDGVADSGTNSDTNSDSSRSASPVPPAEVSTTEDSRSVPFVQVGKWDGLDALLVGGDTSRVSYLDYARAITNESFFYFRGKGSGNDMAVSTHMEAQLLQFAIDNLDSIFTNVPFGTANFNFTPEQMFFIGWNRIVSFPFDVNFKIRNLDQLFANRGSLSHSASVTRKAYTIAPVVWTTLAPASGKTILTLMQEVLKIADPTQFGRIKAQWQRSYVLENATNAKTKLVIEPDGDSERELLPLVCVTLPNNVLTEQWKVEAQNAIASVYSQFGFECQLWVSTADCAQRLSSSHDRTAVLPSLDLLRASNTDVRTREFRKPTIWISTARPKRTAAIFYRDEATAHRTQYVSHVYDEPDTAPTEPKGAIIKNRKEIKPLTRYFLGATPSGHEGNTDQNPVVRHATNGRQFSLRNCTDAATFGVYSTPRAIVTLVANGSARFLPDLETYCIAVKCAKTLSASATASDFNSTPLTHWLLSSAMRALGSTRVEDERLNAMVDETAKMLTGPVTAEELQDGDCDLGIPGRLRRAHRLVAEQYDSLPVVLPENQPHGGNALSIPQKVNLAHRRFLKTVLDAFGETVDQSTRTTVHCLPGTNQPIPPEQLAVLPCCTNVTSICAIASLNGTCPRCFATIRPQAIVTAQATIANIQAATQRRREQQAFRDAQSALAEQHAETTASVVNVPITADSIDNDSMLATNLLKLAAGSVSLACVADYLSGAINSVLAYKPNARILFIFDHADTPGLIEKLAELLRHERRSPRLDRVMSVTKHSTKLFNADEVSEPFLLVLRFGGRKSNAEGLNLEKADAMLADEVSSAISIDKLVQATARTMRPSKALGFIEFKDFPEREMEHKPQLKRRILLRSGNTDKRRIDLQDAPVTLDPDQQL